MPARALKEKQHPAKRSFQAIRIAVNDELASVDRMLPGGCAPAESGGTAGRYHLPLPGGSDRQDRHGGVCPGLYLPARFSGMRMREKPQIRLVSRKPILPSEEEVRDNPRARSAKLRAAEKL